MRIVNAVKTLGVGICYLCLACGCPIVIDLLRTIQEGEPVPRCANPNCGLKW